jgi:hypothetical protein
METGSVFRRVRLDVKIGMIRVVLLFMLVIKSFIMMPKRADITEGLSGKPLMQHTSCN